MTIERHLNDLHPPRIRGEEEAELARGARRSRTPIGEIAETIFGVGRTLSENNTVHRAFVEGIRADARRVYEAVVQRVGNERSLLSIFHRYRQRATWYDLDKLRAVAARGRGKPEDRLTETLAAYLFDHGLNPLTRPMVGRVQPDLLGGGGRFSFYVEAKQYSRAAVSYLLEGLDQVWDMLDELRGTELDVDEAFYVIYRRGGPRYAFEPRVPHRDRVVHTIVVDIAESSERGSNAPPTRTFSLDELTPRPASQRARRNQRRVRRR